MIRVVSEKCPQDHICPMIRVCPKKAITQKGFSAPEINHKECIECMACVNRCPYKVFEKE
ncbi:MAG: 4Fe-4S binding protein [archaeon]